jgi:regulator of sirC expression with transglutaminase-like and TPR domain
MALTFDDFAHGDGDLDAALGAALLARDVYPALDPKRLLARFDDLAAPLGTLGLDRADAHVAAETLSHHLYETLGFSGNEADYYDPRNSLLPDVLDRRLGIPISLALVYCEIAKRVGVEAHGVGFPGHFLVRVKGGASEALVDPFFGGKIMGETELGKLLERVASQANAPARVTPEMLSRASGRVLLQRWLMNLRSIYLSRNDLPRALLVVDRLVSLTPKDPRGDAAEQTKMLLRDRGLLAARLGANAAAREDLSRVLEMEPSSETAKELREALEKLDQKPTVAN